MVELGGWARSVSAGSDANTVVRDLEYQLLRDHPRERDKLVGVYAELATNLEAARGALRGTSIGPRWRESGFAPLLWTMIFEGIAILASVAGLGILFGMDIDRVLPFSGALVVSAVCAVVAVASAWLAEFVRYRDKAVGNDPVTLHIVYAVLAAATAALGWARMALGSDTFGGMLGFWPVVPLLCALAHIALTLVGVRHQKRLVAEWKKIQGEWGDAVKRRAKPTAQHLKQASRRSTSIVNAIPAAARKQLVEDRARALSILSQRGVLDLALAQLVGDAPIGAARITLEQAREGGRLE